MSDFGLTGTSCRFLPIALCALTLALTACPSESRRVEDAPSDTTPDASDGDASAPPDTAPDAAPDVTDTLDTGDSETLEPGGFGQRCDSNEDCDSGYCLEAYGGKVCSRTCTDGCPSGWSCRQDLSVFPDVVNVCVPSFPTLCLPCDSSEACADGGASDGARCLPRGVDGEDGAFCGGACAGEACPDGYRCAPSLDVEGQETPQCVPIDGAACGCSPRAIAEAASTTCATSNALGRCPGRRVCTAAGLSACDAAPPAEDRCDGRDDDCDGVTDEAHVPTPCVVENALGRCEGLTVCGEGGEVCDAPEPQPELCGDELDGDCDGAIDGEGAIGCSDFWLDADGDGVGTGAPRCLCGPDGEHTARLSGDCDDARGTVSPRGVEVCDGLDNDCDGKTDDEGAIGCSVFHRDRDADRFGDPDDALCLCAPDPLAGYVAKTPTDCDDDDEAANPGAPEVCDGVDNDCDAKIDEQGAGGCTLHFVDADGDTYGDPAVFACLCAPDEAHPAARGGDCRDDEAAINPGAPELCGGGDEDCDGQRDEANASGCVERFRDSDGDGHGVSDSRCLCAPADPYDAPVGDDCDDASQAVSPDAVEACNGRDDDCDSVVDEADALGCETYHRDADRDSFGAAGDVACLCAPSTPYIAKSATDCDDDDPYANPTAAEVCNLRDDDCDGATDDGVEGSCSPFYLDADGDGWGVDGDSRCLCGPQGLYRATRAGDCDDAVDTTHPFAPETCNAVDDDCEGDVDEEGASGCTTYYRDPDRDGVGLLGEVRCLCAPAGLHSATSGGDCDESDPEIHPGADEACNAVDDDCDGAVDPADSTGCEVLARDSDRDGYGVAGDALCLCEPDRPYTAVAVGDCNDADPSLSPGDAEVCNGRDDDCSGVVDDPGTTGCVAFFADEDGDAYGAGSSQCLCGPSGSFDATEGGDCDDAEATTNPSIFEQCNGRDDDCDGVIDEVGAAGCAVFLKDVDGDLRGVDGDLQCACAAGPVYRATVGGDCDDARSDVSPDQAELCDGRDNDCDRASDEADAKGCEGYLRDIDGDGYGVSDERCLCGPEGSYRAEAGGDCNDGSAAISPGTPEYCNGIDDDCDGQVDEEGAAGCQRFYEDGDGDGWGGGAGRCLCGPTGVWVTTQAGDCADADAQRNPGLAEACAEDARDEDCDGVVDEANALGCVDHFEDVDADGYGLTTSRTCLCGPRGTLSATRGGDCADADRDVNPAASEVCDAKDDDCDGLYDEGCGLLEGGWPTAKYDRRRSGWGLAFDGPSTKTLRWRVRLNTDTDGAGADTADIQTSAVFDAAGRLFIAVEDRLYRLDPATGATLWQRTLDQPMSAAASITLRAGGTLVVPTGNGLSLYAPDGTRLWYTKLPGAETEPITGSPIVDDDGTIYTVGYSAAYAIDPGGAIRWSIAVPNSQYVPSHVAWSPTNDRLYFGCSNHTLFAVTRAGQIAWTYVVDGQDVDASTVVLLDGTLVQSFGNNFHQVRDDGVAGVRIRELATGGDNDTPPIAWRNASNVELIVSNANGDSGVRTFRASDGNRLWTYAMTKDQSMPNGIGAIDKTGRIYVGDDQGGFHAITTTGTRLWRFASGDGLQGTEIQSMAALQQRAVYFADNAGWLYCLADP